MLAQGRSRWAVSQKRMMIGQSTFHFHFKWKEPLVFLTELKLDFIQTRDKIRKEIFAIHSKRQRMSFRDSGCNFATTNTAQRILKHSDKHLFLVFPRQEGHLIFHWLEKRFFENIAFFTWTCTHKLCRFCPMICRHACKHVSSSMAMSQNRKSLSRS